MSSYWLYKAIKRHGEYLAIIILVAVFMVTAIYIYAEQQPGTSAEVEAGQVRATVVSAVKIVSVVLFIGVLAILLVYVIGRLFSGETGYKARIY